MSDAADTPITIASRKGFYYEIKAGKRYLWCSCGRSKQQPFCDGSHVGTSFLPVAYKAERDEESYLLRVQAQRHAAVLRWRPQQPAGRLPRRRPG